MNLHGIVRPLAFTNDNYTELEVWGVIDVMPPDHYLGGTEFTAVEPESGRKPQMFSVYGRHRAPDEGGWAELELIEDFDTREEALDAAYRMRDDWHLPLLDYSNWEKP